MKQCRKYYHIFNGKKLVCNCGEWRIDKTKEGNQMVKNAKGTAKLREALEECVNQCADFENMTDDCAKAFREARKILRSR